MGVENTSPVLSDFLGTPLSSHYFLRTIYPCIRNTAHRVCTYVYGNTSPGTLSMTYSSATARSKANSAFQRDTMEWVPYSEGFL